MTFGPKPGQDIATWLWCDICNEYCAHGSLTDDPAAVERACKMMWFDFDSVDPLLRKVRTSVMIQVLRAAEETPDG